MRHVILCFALAAGAAGTVPALAQDTAGALPPTALGTLPSLPSFHRSTGPRTEQQIAFTLPHSDRPMPVVLWIGGGADFGRGLGSLATDWLRVFFFDRSLAVVQIGHRTGSHVSAAEMLDDIAAGLAEVARRAGEENLDLSRLVVVGEEAGGHFAALLATDPSYLRAAGLDFGAIRSVLIVNGRGFDVPARIEGESAYLRKAYQRAFGADPAEQQRLSPMAHVAAPNAPSFLFVAGEREGEAVAQAEAMAAALEQVGSNAQVWRLKHSNRQSPRTYLGAPQHPRWADLDTFFKTAEAEPR